MSFFFTIIIATSNAGILLSRTLESLANQNCTDFNVFIQDADSKDNTVLVADEYRGTLPRLLISSEKDAGIYDAWNKALDKWQSELGNWVLFLGAGDTLIDDSILEKVASHLAHVPPSVQYAGGDINNIEEDGKIYQHFCYDGEVGAVRMRHGLMPFPHQGLFHRRSIFLKERFDTYFRIAGDFDLICRTWRKEESIQLPFTITNMVRGGISDSPATIPTTRMESAKVLMRHFPGQWPFAVKLWAKGAIFYLVLKLCGKHALVFLDAFRKLRGLPPAWTHDVN